MAELFGKGRTTITEHNQNVFSENELVYEATSRKFRQVRNEENRTIKREIEHYNLDVIISVGYRVKSKQGTQFRIWANSIEFDCANRKRFRRKRFLSNLGRESHDAFVFSC